MADVHHDDEFRVNQTTPQGSQGNAVEHGHEERDANVGGIMKWLIATGVIAAVAMLLVVGIFKGLEYATEQPGRPSPLYQKNKLPPAPYIEGLVVKGERAGMTEHLFKVRMRESEQLARWQLGESDPHTWSVPMSPQAVRDVPTQPAGDTAATDQMFNQGQLNDASGGLRNDAVR
jgi:hypothetical protein